MDCIKSYVGVRGCGQSEPESGLYINSLPGISLENIEKIADSQQSNFLGAWRDIEARSVKRLSLEVTNVFAKRYRKKSINQTIDIGRNIDKNNPISNEVRYKGFCITTHLNKGYTRSAYQSIFITSLSLFQQASGNFTLKIINMDTLEVLYTKSVTGGTAGWNLVKVGQSFNGRKLFCCYDASNIDSYELPILQSTSNWFSTCCDFYYGPGSSSAYITGISSDLIDLDDNIEQYSNSHGLSGIWSVQCAFDNIVCNNKNVFANALLYLLGAETMIERLASDRINRYTTIDLEVAQKNHEYFMSVYDKEMELAIAGINLSINDACIECNETFQYQESKM
jgi:hypothetical protein